MSIPKCECKNCDEPVREADLAKYPPSTSTAQFCQAHLDEYQRLVEGDDAVGLLLFQVMGFSRTAPLRAPDA